MSTKTLRLKDIPRPHRLTPARGFDATVPAGHCTGLPGFRRHVSTKYYRRSKGFRRQYRRLSTKPLGGYEKGGFVDGVYDMSTNRFRRSGPLFGCCGGVSWTGRCKYIYLRIFYIRHRSTPSYQTGTPPWPRRTTRCGLHPWRRASVLTSSPRKGGRGVGYVTPSNGHHMPSDLHRYT